MIARVKKEELKRMSHEMALAVKLASREHGEYLLIERHVAVALKLKYRPELLEKDKEKWRGLGDVIHAVAAPIGRALGMDCFEKNGELKPASPCGQRRASWNEKYPFNP